MWIEEAKEELVNMTWDYYEKKSEEERRYWKFGGRGMKITLDAIRGRLMFYRAYKEKEDKEYVKILEEAQEQAKTLINKLNEANEFFEKNKENLRKF